MNEALAGAEVRYPWLPSNTRIVDFEHYIVVRYKGMEVPYSTNTTEEFLKEEILGGGLEKKIRARHSKDL